MSWDLHIEGLPPGENAGSKFVSFGNYPRVLGVRGIYKLFVRFLKCFLTPKGTDLGDPDYGTSLLAAFTGNLQAVNISALASQSIQEVTDKLHEYDNEYELDDSERLAAVEIEDMYVDEENYEVVIKVNVSNVEGSVALFLIPVVAGEQS